MAIGSRILRSEDRPLLTGGARFVDDTNPSMSSLTGPNQVELMGSLIGYKGEIAILSATTESVVENADLVVIAIKPQDPNENGIIYPGIFYPWVMPEDPTQPSGTCGIGGGGEQGAAAYSQNICTCNNSEILLGVDYEMSG